MLLSVLLGMSTGALGAAIWWIHHLTRQIARLETERSVLFDRLLIKAGQAPIVHQREEVVKIPDMEAMPVPDLFQMAYADDEILEEAERLFPPCKGLSLDQVKQQHPNIYDQAASIYRHRHANLRV